MSSYRKNMPGHAEQVLANADVSPVIYQHGTTADMVKLSRTSSSIHHTIRDRVRDRLATYLRTFVPSGKLMDQMRSTSLTVFDQSAFVFLHGLPEIREKIDTLYLVCTTSDESQIIAFLTGEHFQTIKTHTIFHKRTYHLTLNKNITEPTLFRRGAKFISLVCSTSDSILPPALGTLSTSFMSIISAKSFWSAYRTGPRGRDSFQNPSYASGPCPKDFPKKIEHAHAIAKQCSIQNHLLIWRLLVERPHKHQCSTHPECPQTLRNSSDDYCTFMYFDSDYRTCSSKDLRLERTRNTKPTMWRLGGTCYRDTVAMTPVCFVAGDLDRPLFEDSITK